MEWQTVGERMREASVACFISHFYPPREQSLNSCDTLFKPSYGEVVAYCISDGK